MILVPQPQTDPISIGSMLEDLRRHDAEIRSVAENLHQPVMQIASMLPNLAPAPGGEGASPLAGRLMVILQFHDIFSQRVAHVFPVLGIIWRIVDQDGSPRSHSFATPGPQTLPMLFQAASLASGLLRGANLEFQRAVIEMRDIFEKVEAKDNLARVEVALGTIEHAHHRLRSAEFTLEQLHRVLERAVPGDKNDGCFNDGCILELPAGEFDDLLAVYSMAPEHVIHHDNFPLTPLPEKSGVEAGDLLLF